MNGMKRDEQAKAGVLAGDMSGDVSGGEIPCVQTHGWERGDVVLFYRLVEKANMDQVYASVKYLSGELRRRKNKASLELEEKK